MFFRPQTDKWKPVKQDWPELIAEGQDNTNLEIAGHQSKCNSVSSQELSPHPHVMNC